MHSTRRFRSEASGSSSQYSSGNSRLYRYWMAKTNRSLDIHPMSVIGSHRLWDRINNFHRNTSWLCNPTNENINEFLIQFTSREYMYT